MLRPIAVLALALAFVPASAQTPVYHGYLSVLRAGRGTINVDTGRASFHFSGWQYAPKETSNGVDPGTEPIAIGIADERFLIPAGQMKVSRNKRKYRYSAKTDRGIQLLKLVRIPSDSPLGAYKVALKVAGVDLSTLIVSEPPKICQSFAIIIGDDDGFSGVWFERPNPFPSTRLTLPGFCSNPGDWPWL